MQSHTISSYDKDLLALRGKVMLMLSLVKKLHNLSMNIFAVRDNGMIAESISIDKSVNRLDEEIENLAVQILALRNPIGVDLREAVSTIKMAVILERMGDLAKNTITRLGGDDTKIPNDITPIITQLHGKIFDMVCKLENAYQNFNIDLAKEIFLQDSEIDTLYREIKSQLEDKIEQDPSSTKQIMKIIFALKNYERFADYICKIATLVLYIITSERKFVGI